jgi:hypothetical protein
MIQGFISVVRFVRSLWIKVVEVYVVTVKPLSFATTVETLFKAFSLFVLNVDMVDIPRKSHLISEAKSVKGNALLVVATTALKNK